MFEVYEYAIHHQVNISVPSVLCLFHRSHKFVRPSMNPLPSPQFPFKDPHDADRIKADAMAVFTVRRDLSSVSLPPLLTASSSIVVSLTTRDWGAPFSTML